MKTNPALYWVLSVVIVSILVFVYLARQEAPQATAVIRLSYYADEAAISEDILKNLDQEIKENQFFWIGVEPEKNEQLNVALQLKNRIQQNVSLEKIIVDEELNLPTEVLTAFGNPETISVKNNIYEIGEKLAELENNKTKYLLVTASIYSNSVIKKNPIFIMKEKNHINPMTFSFGYFPINADDEKNMLFSCDTEDRTGTSDWGCLVANTSRSARRKLNFSDTNTWISLMSRFGEKDYILLLKKK